VLFVVPDDNRKAQIGDVLSQLPADHSQLFQVSTAETVVRAIASGELVNTNQTKEVTS
jgi:hypothetical protein